MKKANNFDRENPKKLVNRDFACGNIKNENTIEKKIPDFLVRKKQIPSK
jgi:hypothetical protein